MNNGKERITLEQIAEELAWQGAAIEALLRHVAHLEATLAALVTQSLAGEKLLKSKALKDHMQPKIVKEMASEIEKAIPKHEPE